MMALFRSLLLIGVTLLSGNVFSQQDTIFWFAAPEVSASAGDTPIFLRFMTYGNAADVTVSLPANGGFTPITVSIPANSVDSVNLTSFLAQIESPAGDVVSNNGIRVVATEEISAFYELKNATNKELFSLKGNKGLGDNFYTPFQRFWDNGSTTPASFSSIDIVATENNTTVLITPRTAIIGHAQDVTYSVVLNQGETYSARDMNVSAASSLAGSIVSSDKPISVTVFSGALTNGGCTSTMGDQITPEDFTGRNFIVQGATGGNDRIYILGTQNGTNITVENSTTTNATISWGETFELATTDAINYISTNKPVYVWHTTGYGCELSGAQVPNLLCAGKYSSAFTRTTTDSIGLVIYTRTGFEGQFALNGNGALIPSAAFNPVPGTAGAYQAAVIYYNTSDVPVNSYNEVTNTGDIFGMAVIAGNDGNGSGYAYLSEFTSYPFIEAGLNDTVCANTTFPINGSIGGGDVTGVWSTSGFGTFSSATNVLNNVYVPSALDTLISPINVILTTTGSCPVLKDTIVLEVETAPIVSASADQSLCENNAIATLAGSIQGGATTGYWSTNGTGSFLPDSSALDAQYVPSATDINNGGVELVLISTNVGSCIPESDTMNITYTQGPTVDAGPQDTVFVCENNAVVNLNGTVSGVTTTGKWISSGNGIFSPDNLDLNGTYQPSFADISSGEIWIYLESTTNQNCIAVQDSFLVQFTPAPTVDAGAGILSCSNDAAVTLNGVIGGATTTGVWTGGNGTFTADSTDLNATYTPTAAEVSNGFLFLTLTSTNNLGCTAETDIVQIEFVAPPTANFSVNDVCLNEQTIFTDFSNAGFGAIDTWQWDFGSAGATSNNQNDVYTYASPGTYDVELIVTSVHGCSDTITQQTEVFDIPVADYTYTANCNNNQVLVQFTDASTISNGTINFWFYDFGGQGTSATANPLQPFASNGDFTVLHYVETTDGCRDSISQIVSIPPAPIANFSYNTNNGLNIGAVFNFINTSTNATSYDWDFGNGNTSIDEDPNNTYFANGNYLVTLTVENGLGCTDSTSEIISINTVTNEISTLIPNAISPNGDLRNDVWKLEFLELLYPNARVEIFNEWGQLIFESDGYDVPWDGRFNNEYVPDGTYYYIIDLKDTDDPETDIFKGALLVLKERN
ncbi:MAG: PKD domain-containing protein [bacterium]|nr:PKD domain-containing protein [bacterium]